MSDPAEPELSFAQHPPAPLRWRSWPVQDSAVGTLMLVLGLLAAAVVIHWLTRRMVLALLALLALAISLWRFFLPVVFELNDEGVDQWFFGRRRRISWQAIGSYEVCSAGVLLLPDKDRSAMVPFRGLYVPWTTHRDEVIAHVRHHLDRPEKA